MDVRLHSNPQQHYAVNGGVSQNARQGEDDLQSLSQDVQECIQFFDETIVSLEESLQEEDPSRGQVKAVAGSHGPAQRDGPLTFSHSPMSSILAQRPSPKDQDIIDLVRPEPALVQQPTFNSITPGFHRMMSGPESHLATKPRRDQVDGFPSEYNPPLPSGSYGPADSHAYHPPGCIPTPVLIAQKIAENKSGGPSAHLPSSLHRRQSMESEKPHGYSTDSSVKQGPPTSAKPTRFPANISVIHTNKDHQNQPGANVNVHERQVQMLANLPGTSHHLMQDGSQQAAEQVARNPPTRSISFKDPTPDISRMEALSKLGLNRNRAMSAGISLIPSSTTFNPLPGGQPSAKPLEASLPSPTEASTKGNAARPPQGPILRTDSLRSQENRNPQPSTAHSAGSKSSFNPPLEPRTPVSPVPEVSLLEFNSYGGKSIVVHPSFASKSESATSPTSPNPKNVPHALSKPSEFNTYGGKSKVMNPPSGATTKNDLPDILSSHIDKSQALPPKSEPLPADLNPYGGKSQSFNPSSGLHRPDSQAKSFKAPAPSTAPKPHRHTVHAPQKAAPQVLSPDHNRRSGSVFRPQGITVQFSGRGPMNDSRREALRKLGLLKNS